MMGQNPGEWSVLGDQVGGAGGDGGRAIRARGCPLL